MRRYRPALSLLLIGGVLLMATAPLVAGWQRRSRNQPGPQPGASQRLGVPLLTDQLGAGARIVVEAAWGALLTNPTSTWTWYDVTADVMQAGGSTVSISPVGRQDETTTAQPAGCTFMLINSDGRYTPFNPTSSNWPNVKRNTPIRVRVTLDGGANWWVRFQGYANGFTPSWDKSANLAIVTVSASGVSRRLNQGKTPLRSAMARGIPASTPAPLAYWPLEDGTSSTQAASSVAGVPALVAQGTVAFAAIDGPPGSDKLAGMSGGSLSAASLRAGAFVDSFRVEFSLKYAATLSTTANRILSMTLAASAAGLTQIELDANNASSAQGLYLTYVFGGASTTAASLVAVDDGAWHLVALDVFQNGANVSIALWIDNVNVLNTAVAGTTLAYVSGLTVNPARDSSQPPYFGQLIIRSSTSSNTRLFWLGYAGAESPAVRMTRLCAEEGVPFHVVGFYDTTAVMGPQGVDTFMNLMRECEGTDAGFLYDGLSDGFLYQGISQRYNQSTALTLDASTGDLADFAPVDDDQRNRNLVKVTRTNGSFGSAEDVDGDLGTDAIGVYDEEVVTNPSDDSGLFYRASWEVHAGTIAGLRYPTVVLDLAASPTVAQGWLNRSDGFSGPVPPGSRIDVANISSVATQHPAGTVSLMLEGYAEEISPVTWTVVGNCIPNRIYDVFKVEDPLYGRLVSAGGSSLAVDAAVGSTSLTVQSTDLVPWTTTAVHPDDFPFDLNIDGIQATVTAISGAASPQTFTVTGVTRALSAGDSVNLWKPGVIKL